MKQLFNYIITMCIMLMITSLAHAQKKTNMHFVYIAHEVDTPVNDLCRKMQSLRDNAIKTDEILIIYLSTGLSDNQYCIQSYTNIKDVTGNNRNSEDAFNSIIAALQNANSHSVEPREDVKNILQLFSHYNFQNNDKSLKYNKITWDFYVGSQFWKLGYNEKVLAHLFADFDIPSMPKDVFFFNVLKPKGDQIIFKDSKPFGNANLQDINSRVRIIEY